MGGVCTPNSKGQSLIECPHHKKRKKGANLSQIKAQFEQKQTCELCLYIKSMKDRSQQSNFELIRILLSQTAQKSEEVQNIASKKSSKLIKKTLKDFEVVRGLGKGAFGRVYLIKERQDQELLAVQKDILSLKVEQIHNFQAQIAEDMCFQMKPQTQMQSEKQSERSIMKNIQNKEYREFFLISDKEKNIGSSKLTTKDSKISNASRYYSLKIISKSKINTSKQKKQAISERYILEAMDHPFIVKLHYAFQTQSRLFLIVDLLRGGELFYLLRKMKKFNQKMAKFYAAEILLAIEYLHQRSIIYRDIKPQNILLDAQGHIKITDFGLSKVMYSSNQRTYSLCGTLEYMAPQVIMGGGYTQAADWFSFGSLLYDMLTGYPPFLSHNKSSMMRNLVTKQVPIPYYLSQQAKSLLNGLFSIKPEKRLGWKQDAVQIRKHPFFKEINFNDIYNKKVTPPVCFSQSINNLFENKQQIFLNSGGFQKWASWQLNMESLEAKRSEQGGQKFLGFTYGNQQHQQQNQIIQNEQLDVQI